MSSFQKAPLVESQRDRSRAEGKIRVITWSLIDGNPGDILQIPSLDLPSGGPAHGFWCIQDSTTALAMTQDAFIKAREAKKTIIFHRIDFDLGSEDVSPGKAKARDSRVLSGISLLALDDISAELSDEIMDRVGVSSVVSQSKHQRSTILAAFRDNPCQVGDAIFEVIPSLRAITWRLTSSEFTSGMVRAACVRKDSQIIEVQHLAGGIGVIDMPWEIAPGAYIHCL